MIAFRPTTRADIAALDLDLAWRIRAETAVVDGAPVAVGGITYLPDGTVAAFVEPYDAISRFPVGFTRAVRRGLAAARARGVRRIVALADVEGAGEAAERWLRRLGFHPVEAPGALVYVWEW